MLRQTPPPPKPVLEARSVDEYRKLVAGIAEDTHFDWLRQNRNLYADRMRIRAENKLSDEERRKFIQGEIDRLAKAIADSLMSDDACSIWEESHRTEDGGYFFPEKSIVDMAEQDAKREINGEKIFVLKALLAETETTKNPKNEAQQPLYASERMHSQASTDKQLHNPDELIDLFRKSMARWEVRVYAKDLKNVAFFGTPGWQEWQAAKEEAKSLALNSATIGEALTHLRKLAFLMEEKINAPNVSSPSPFYYVAKDTVLCNWLQNKESKPLQNAIDSLLRLQQIYGNAPLVGVTTETPSVEPLFLIKLFHHVSDYHRVMVVLVEKGYCEANTYIWTDSKSGSKSLLIGLLKSIQAKGYLIRKPSNEEYVAIAKNTFQVEVSVDTCKRSKQLARHEDIIPFPTQQA
jgi:hypothetical protein